LLKEEIGVSLYLLLFLNSLKVENGRMRAKALFTNLNTLIAINYLLLIFKIVVIGDNNKQIPLVPVGVAAELGF